MSEDLIRSTRYRLNIVDASAKLAQLGLNKGTAGNVSVRWDAGFLITPSGLPPYRIHPEDIVYIDMEGRAEGRCTPSSEWRIHRDVYLARPEVGAVVHTHSPFCTALAVARKSIPAYHYMIAKAGGSDIRCAGYGTFGSQELSDRAMEALEGRYACLLANHGMLAIGATLEAAMGLAVEVEELAEGYWRALQLGEPSCLSDAEIEAVLERFKTYGENVKRSAINPVR
jgi:L-fuculose-phosphate aldolase